MTKYLFPRLGSGQARLWAETFEQMSPADVEKARPPILDQPGIQFAPTGAERIPREELEELRERLVAIAGDHGYPERRRQDDQRQFELKTAMELMDLPIVPGEALRNEVWQAVTCLLVPDLVAWRFGSTDGGRVVGPTSTERFLAGPRNLLQRIWWRGRILRDSTRAPEDMLWRIDTAGGGLTEDNMVQLLERENIGAFPDLCRTIADEFMRCRPHVSGLGESPEERLLREVMKKVVRVVAFAQLEVLEEDVRTGIIAGLFAESVTAMGGEVPQQGRIYRTLVPVAMPDGLRAGSDLLITIPADSLLHDDEVEGTVSVPWRALGADGRVHDEGLDEIRPRWHKTDADRVTLSFASGGLPTVVNEDSVLVLATRYDTERFIAAFVLERRSALGMQVLGALWDQDYEVDDEVEDFVRTELHRRL